MDLKQRELETIRSNCAT